MQLHLTALKSNFLRFPFSENFLGSWYPSGITSSAKTVRHFGPLSGRRVMLVPEQERRYHTCHNVPMDNNILNLRLKTQPQFLKQKALHKGSAFKILFSHSPSLLPSITLLEICKGKNIWGKLKLLVSVPRCSCSEEERTKCANTSEFRDFPTCSPWSFPVSMQPLKKFQFGLTAHTDLLTLNCFLGSFDVA